MSPNSVSLNYAKQNVLFVQDSFDSAIIPLGSDLSMREKYASFHNTVRVGRLLEDLDVFAVTLCYKHILNPKQPKEIPSSPYSIVTALVDQIDIAAQLKVFFLQDNNPYDVLIAFIYLLLISTTLIFGFAGTSPGWENRHLRPPWKWIREMPNSTTTFVRWPKRASWWLPEIRSTRDQQSWIRSLLRRTRKNSSLPPEKVMHAARWPRCLLKRKWNSNIYFF